MINDGVRAQRRKEGLGPSTQDLVVYIRHPLYLLPSVDGGRWRHRVMADSPTEQAREAHCYWLTLGAAHSLSSEMEDLVSEGKEHDFSKSRR